MDIKLCSYGRVSTIPIKLHDLFGALRPEHVSICWLTATDSSDSESGVILAPAGRKGNYYIDIGYKVRMKPKHLYVMHTLATSEIVSDENRVDDIYFLHMDIWPFLNKGIVEIDISDISRCMVLMNAITHLINEPIEIVLPLVTSLFSCSEILESLDFNTNSNILKVTNYIQHNYHLQLNNTDLAAIANYNTNYFIRVFKQETGLSPYEYIQNVRLTNAMNLLRNGTPIKEIAQICGYSSQKVFCRSFKNHYAHPPSYYYVK